MNDITPRPPRGILRWTDAALDLADRLAHLTTPAYLVGGVVRDAFLGRPLTDLDLVTERGAGVGLARQIANLYRGDFFKLDAERDVGRAIIPTPSGQLTVDVSGYRGADLAADLADRDFTINAMAVDVRGDLRLLIDPLNGEADLARKVLRQCSPTAVVSDPVRALRAVRQSVQFGAHIEPGTLAAVRAAHLDAISPERVRDELFKMLSLPKAHTALRVLDTLGLLAQVLPETAWLHETGTWALSLSTVQHMLAVMATISPQRTDDTAAQFRLGMIVMTLDRYRARLHTHLDARYADGRSHRALLALAALLCPIGAAPMADRAAALRLSNAERARIAVLGEHIHLASAPDRLDPLALYHFWQIGDAGVDVCLLGMAHFLAQAALDFHQDAWVRYLETTAGVLDAWYERREQAVDPPALVSGSDLMRAFRLTPGPIVGQLIETIREAQVTGEVITRDDALAFARRWLDTHAAADDS